MRAAKVDANHMTVVKALLEIGCSVQSLASVGVGCPDILWGRGGKDGLIEVKNPETIRGQKQGTIDAQKRWRQSWKGRPPVTVWSAYEAVAAVLEASKW